jgi:gas vesicle protein
MSKNSNILLGLALGVAAGAAAAYLLASEETREKIKTRVRKAADTIIDELENAARQASNVNQEETAGHNNKP